MKVAVIGKGHVGTALATGLSRTGHEVKFGHRDLKEPVDAAVKWGEMIVFAVPHEAVMDVAEKIGAFVDGKTVLDVTNAVTERLELAFGCTTSVAEEIQKKLPKAHVVKAFNTVFAQNQSVGKIGDEQLTLFVAADDAEAKRTVMQLGRDIGFEPVDVGSLKSARYLEPMAILLINLAYGLGMGSSIGYKLVKS